MSDETGDQVEEAEPVEETEPHAAEPQRIGWLELFYDLVFVVVVAMLAHRLTVATDYRTLAGTAGLMFVVWMAWFNTTSLTNLAGEIRPRHRPFVFASMAGVGVMALGLSDLGDRLFLFTLGYAVARVALWPLWAMSAKARGQGQLRPFLFGPGLAVLWLLSVLLPGPWIWWSWFLLMVAELSLSLVRPGRDGELTVRFDADHMLERIGAFVMIVTGESVVQIITALDARLSAATWVVAGLGFVMICSFWWLFYDSTIEHVHEVLEGREQRIVDFIGGGQYLIVLGLVGVAGGLAGAIEHAGVDGGHAALPPTLLAVLCGGVLAFTLGITSMSRSIWRLRLDPELADRRRVPLGGFFVFLIPALVWWFGRGWAPWLVVLVLLLITLSVVLKEVTQEVAAERLGMTGPGSVTPETLATLRDRGGPGRGREGHGGERRQRRGRRGSEQSGPGQPAA